MTHCSLPAGNSVIATDLNRLVFLWTFFLNVNKKKSTLRALRWV